MDIDAWKRLRELTEACAQQPPSERLRWLSQQGVDEALRAQVLDLLDSDHGSSDTDLLDRPLPFAQPELAPGASLGPWRLLGQIGEGGMGTVWRAERSSGGFIQQAAIKMLHGGLGRRREALARFEAERQILADLQHPNIATLLDGGCSECGQPWLAMEYVAGEDILGHCNRHRVGIQARLQLFFQVAEAVAHAHRRLIVHRDIKPSNVLVSPEGQVKLLDFGVAKLLAVPKGSGPTQTRIAPMTPAYAAPEQLRGEHVGTEADVFALGLLLYELLCGLLPQAGRRQSSAEAVIAALGTDPTPPSAALARLESDPSRRAALAAERATRPRELARTLRGDLDAILLKALRPRPEERYATVEALVDDLRRYMQRRPVRARRGTRRYLLGRFVSRHRVPAALSLLLLSTLLMASVQAMLQARSLARERDHALVQQQRANATLRFQQEMFRQANPDVHGGREPSASEMLDLGERLLSQRSGLDSASHAALLEALARSRISLGQRERARPLLVEGLQRLEDSDDEAARLGLEALLASVDYASGRQQDAETRLRVLLAPPIIERLPRRARASALGTLGTLHGNRRDFDAAVAALAEGAELLYREDGGPSLDWIQYRGVWGFYLMLAGRVEEGLALFEATERELGDNPELGPVASYRFESGYVSAMEMAGRMDVVAERAPRLLDAALGIYGPMRPGTASAYMRMGNVEFHRGNIPQAIVWARQAIDAAGNLDGGMTPLGFRRRVTLAEFCLAGGDLECAEEVLAVVTDPRWMLQVGEINPARPRAMLAVLRENQGRIGEALELAQALHAGHPEAWAGLGEQQRVRLQAIVLAAATEGATSCTELAALHAGTEDAAARLVVAAYLQDCQRGAGMPLTISADVGADAMAALRAPDPLLATRLDRLQFAD